MIALALSLSLAAGAPGPAAAFADANALYLAGDFEGAAGAYEALVAAGVESPALHVNLGCARFRSGRRGAAIASFERALRLDPRDADARADLALARGRNEDRLAAAAERPFLAHVAERTPDAWAAGAFAVPWATLWILLAILRAARGRTRALLRLAAAAAGIAAALGGAVLASRAAERRAPIAIVVAPASPVRNGLEQALRPAFQVHEGTAVVVLEERGEAARVRLANGVEGWMRPRDLERL